ncbi:MAG: hypothetical protein HC871_08275 [Rhizobiales bacterium]|nr:hypothetical protein [Hyphomicrobiales bacterium]
MAAWTDLASQSESRILQARYTVAFATIGFGGVMATFLGQNGQPVLGYIFLFFMTDFALLLNFHFCRQGRAWSKTRELLETFALVVSYHGIHLGKQRAINIKKPHELWQEFNDDYAVRPLDWLSRLFVTIALFVMILCAFAMLKESETYCELDISSGFSCRWAESASAFQGAERQ